MNKHLSAVKSAVTTIKENKLKLNVQFKWSNSPRTTCHTYHTGRTFKSVISIGWLIRVGYTLGIASMLHILLHEYGHAFIASRWHKLEPRDRRRWTALFGDVSEHADTAYTLKKYCCTIGAFNNTEHYSWYSTTSSHEDWAETFAAALQGETGYGKVKKKIRFANYLMTKYAS